MAKLLENTRKQLEKDYRENNPGIKLDPVILPVIRGAMANLIADDICGVQPMSSPHSKDEWPYQIDVLTMDFKYSQIVPMRQWCAEMFAEDEWTAMMQYFAFKTEEAYAWFKLRWS